MKQRRPMQNQTAAIGAAGNVIPVNIYLMKILLILVLLLSFSLACKKDGITSAIDRPCGTYKSGQSLRKGPEGGCYYINSNGNKTYVEREACSC